MAADDTTVGSRPYWRVRYPEQIAGGAQAKIELTALGLKIVANLRAHKARGGSFASFSVAALPDQVLER